MIKKLLSATRTTITNLLEVFGELKKDRYCFLGNLIIAVPIVIASTMAALMPNGKGIYTWIVFWAILISSVMSIITAIWVVRRNIAINNEIIKESEHRENNREWSIVHIPSWFCDGPNRWKLQQELGPAGVMAALDLLVSCLDSRRDGCLDGLSFYEIARMARWNGDPETLIRSLEDNSYIESNDGELEFADIDIYKPFCGFEDE